MAPPEADGRRANLRRRILSAIVLAPVVLAAVLFGPPWFDLLVLAAAGVLAWEWSRLVGEGGFGVVGLLLLGTVLLVIGASLVLSPGLAVAAVGIAAAVLFGAAAALGGQRPAWIAAGLAYIALPCIAVIWLRARPATGLDLVVWLMLATWAADTGAYFVGRSVGGPRLAPRLSPGKTWSGFLGGLAAAAIVGGGYAALRGAGDPAAAALAGLVLGLAAAGGDLLESATKRRFHVKDAGAIIPGHGGLFDRVDGLLLAILATAVLTSFGWELL